MKQNLLLKSAFCFWVLTVLHAQLLFGQAPKKIFLENLTGSWCGLCPGAFVMMDSLLMSYPNIFDVYIHQNDPMEIEDGAIIGDEYSGGGVPGFLIDRKLYDNSRFILFGLEYEKLIKNLSQQRQLKSPVAIAIESVRRHPIKQDFLNVKLNAKFFSSVKTVGWRWNLFIIENNVTGEGNKYKQVSFYNDVEGHPYEGAGLHLQDYQFKHVVRSMEGGAWGFENSFRNGMQKAFSEQEYQITIPMDPSWNLNEIQLVAILQKYDAENSKNRSIQNVEIADLKSVLANEHKKYKAFQEEQLKVLKVSTNAHYQLVDIYFYIGEDGPVEWFLRNDEKDIIRKKNIGQLNAGYHHISFHLNESELKDEHLVIGLKSNKSSIAYQLDKK